VPAQHDRTKNINKSDSHVEDQERYWGDSPRTDRLCCDKRLDLPCMLITDSIVAEAKTIAKKSGWVLAVIVYSIVGCGPSVPSPILSVERSFHEIFAPVGTIVLDPDVIVAVITFADVSNGGDLLVSDYSMGQLTVFGPSGEFLRSMDTRSCSPGTNFRPMHARFLGDGSVVASTDSETFLFDVSGACLRAVEALTPPLQSYCARGDTLFGYTPLRHRPVIRWYSSTLIQLGEMETEEPRFPRLTMTYQGLWGLQIACSESGVYYLYPGSSDARLAGAEGERLHSPAYYHPPSRDRKRGDMAAMIADGRELRRESTLAAAVFALDEHHRIVAFANSPRNGGSFSMGLNIVSDLTDHAPGVSTFIQEQPLAARNGLLYVAAAVDPEASQGVGNPTIRVYRYLPIAAER